MLQSLVSKNEKRPTRRAVKKVCPKRPIRYYPEGIQWRVNKNITYKEFSATEKV